MKKRIKLMCITGVFTAAIFVFTAYLHIPSHTGYTHVGDGLIYIAACMLPLPYAMFAGAVGGALADCLTGFAVWAPGTVIIKSVTVLLFSSKKSKIICGRNLFALIPAALVCAAGYYLYESAIVGNLVSPLAGIPGYITQSTLSSILYVALGMALDRLNAKNKISDGVMIK